MTLIDQGAFATDPDAADAPYGPTERLAAIEARLDALEGRKQAPAAPREPRQRSGPPPVAKLAKTLLDAYTASQRGRDA